MRKLNPFLVAMPALALGALLAATLTATAKADPAAEVQKREYRIVGTQGELNRWEDEGIARRGPRPPPPTFDEASVRS